MRIRPSDAITDVHFHIGVCRTCGRYGQLDKTTRVCAVTDPPNLFKMTPSQEGEWFRRVRYCNRVRDKRANR